MLSMPRLTASRASSLWLQRLSGSSLFSGGLQASATIAQTCSGVNVAGAPGRGSSARRATTAASAWPDPAAAPMAHCIFGQTPSCRVISRTSVSAAERRIISARSASLRGVLCARARPRRSASASCSGVNANGGGQCDRCGALDSPQASPRHQTESPLPANCTTVPDPALLAMKLSGTFAGTGGRLARIPWDYRS